MTEDTMNRAEQYTGTNVPELYIEDDQPQTEGRVEQRSEIATIVSQVHEKFTSLRDGRFFKNPLAAIFQEAGQLTGPEWKREVLKRLDVLSYRSEAPKLKASLETAKVSISNLESHLAQLLQIAKDNPRLSRSQRHQLENRVATISQMLQEHLQRATASASYYEAFVESVRNAIEHMPVDTAQSIDQGRFAKTWDSIRTIFTGNKALGTIGSAALLMTNFSGVSAQDEQQQTWVDHLETAADQVEHFAESAHDTISQLIDQIMAEFQNLQAALSFSIDKDDVLSQIESLGLEDLSEQIVSEFRERTAHLDLAADLEAQIEVPIGTATLAPGFSTINVRELPATGSTAIVGQLTGSNIVEVLDDTVEGEEYATGGVSSSNWIRVRMTEGSIGYIWSGALNVELNQTDEIQASPVPEPLPTATPETVETSEIPASILNIPIKFVSTTGESSVSTFTLGQLAELGAINAEDVKTSIDTILNLGLPPEVFNNGTNLYLLFHTTESFVGAPDPTLEQITAALQNSRIVTFQTAETVTASDGFTHESGELFLIINGSEQIYLPVGQVFDELRRAQEQYDLGTFTTSREGSLLVPDTTNEIVSIIDTATGQTTAIIDLRTLHSNNGAYGPGVINIVAGAGYQNIVRGDDGQIVAIETPEGPLQLEDMGSVRVAKRAAETNGLNFNTSNLTERQRELVASLNTATLSEQQISLLNRFNLTSLSDAETSAMFGTVTRAPAELLNKENVTYNQETAAIEWTENGETYRWRFGMSETQYTEGYFGQVQERGRFGSPEHGFVLISEYDDFAEWAGIQPHPDFLKDYPELNQTLMTEIASYFPNMDNQINYVYLHNTSGNRVPNLQQLPASTQALTSLRVRTVDDKAFITIDISRFIYENDGRAYTRYLLLALTSGLDMIENNLGKPNEIPSSIQGVGAADIVQNFYNSIYERLDRSSIFFTSPTASVFDPIPRVQD